MTDISVSKSNPIWLIIWWKCVLMGSLGCFWGMTKIKTRILITKKAIYLERAFSFYSVEIIGVG
jgi:hypothetical protein